MSQDILVDERRQGAFDLLHVQSWLPQTRGGRVVLVLSLIAVALLAGTGIAIWYLRAEAFAHARSETFKLSRVLSEQTAQVLLQVDAMARAEVLRMQTGEDASAPPDRIHERLQRRVHEAPQVAALFITDASGHVLHSSYSHPPPDSSVARRSYFIAQHNRRESGLYISEVDINATLHEPTFWLSRALRDDHGLFKGIVVVTIRQRYFEALYRSLELAGDATIALYRSDGTGLVSASNEPAWVQSIAALVAEKGEFAAPRGARGAASHNRFSAIEPVRGFPLVVAVSLTDEALFGRWRQSAWAIGINTTFAMGLLALLMVILHRHSTRQDADERRLRHSESLLQEAQHIAHVGSWTYSVATRQVQCSQEACSVLLLDPQEPPSRHAIFQNIHRDDRWLLLHAVSTAVRAGRADTELRVCRGLRAPRWIQVRIEQSASVFGTNTLLRGTVLDITERKEAEASRAQLAAIVESTEEAIVSLSLDGTVLSWNRGAERIYGYAAADVIGKNAREVFSPADDVDTRALLDIVRSGQSVEHYETTRSTRNGEKIDVALTVSPIVDARDRMVAASYISRDISAQKREATRRDVEHAVTRALLRGDSSTQALQEVIQILCQSLGWDYGARWYPDPERNALRRAEAWVSPGLQSPAFEARAGDFDLSAPPAERGLVSAVFDSGRALWSIDILDHPQFMRAEWARAAGLRTAFMFPVRSTSGTIGVIEFFSCERREPEDALFETAEAISGQIGQYIEHQHAQEERLAADARLQRIMANIPDVVFQLTRTRDGTFKLPFISERVFDLYGARPAELMDNPAQWLAAVVPEHRQLLLKSLVRSKRMWQPWCFEVSVLTRSGMHKWIRGQASVRYSSNGAVYWDGVLSDITLQKRSALEILTLNEKLEKRVEERTHRLEAMNRELEAFSYSVSHDLRAPLRAVEGFCSILLQKYGATLDATAARYLARVQAAGQRMGELVDDLLKLSRISRTELERKDVDLTSIARAVIAELQEADPARTVGIHIEDGVTVNGDARLLHVVLENLLGNAWKFTQKTAHPRIEFGKTWRGGSSPVYIRDNGAGFDMKYAHKLFAPFQRLHRSGDFEGTGIGLATVQRVIALHGGRAWAEAEAGNGATFYFTLG